MVDGDNLLSKESYLTIGSDANTQKFFTRDISRIALLKKKMRDLDADQAVFPSDANYFDSARDFASKYHKVFYDEAWDANFWNQIITNSEAMLDSWNAFASKAIGNIFVVGTPISPNDPQLQSIVVYKVILPALQKNPHATALIIVDPTNFENWNTVWTPKTGVLDSTKSPADNKVTSDVKFEKVAALRPTDELNLENQDGLSENLTFDEA